MARDNKKGKKTAVNKVAFPCSVCDKASRLDAIQCNKCSMWVHRECVQTCTRHLEKNTDKKLDTLIGSRFATRRSILNVRFGADGLTSCSDSIVFDARVQKARSTELAAGPSWSHCQAAWPGFRPIHRGRPSAVRARRPHIATSLRQTSANSGCGEGDVTRTTPEFSNACFRQSLQVFGWEFYGPNNTGHR